MMHRRSAFRESLRVAVVAVVGLLGSCAAVAQTSPVANQVVVAARTKNEPIAPYTTMTALGSAFPVYVAKTAAMWPTPATQTLGVSQWGQFDFAGTVPVVIKRTDVAITSAVVKTIIAGAPYSFTPTFTSSQVNFTISTPGQYYVCINNDWANAMYVFANPLQTSAPTSTGVGVQVLKPGSYSTSPVLTGGKTILYLGPGRYFLTGAAALNMGANQEIYMADGAFLYLSDKAQSASVGLYGVGSSLMGRGVIDGSMQPNPSGLPMVEVSNAKAVLDGIVFRDNTFVAVDVRSAKGAPIANNFKVMGWRLNSDGCHIDSSVGATISNSFVRSYDDEIAVNNNSQSQATANFFVSNMMLFKQKAHAIFMNLGFQSASSGTVSGVYIIQDYSSEATPMIGVQVVDNGTVGPGILIENIFADQVQNFLGMSITRTAWTLGTYSPGAVTGITFSNISAPLPAQKPYVAMSGYGPNNIIENTVFSNIKLGGQPLTWAQVSVANEYVAGTVITP